MELSQEQINKIAYNIKVNDILEYINTHQSEYKNFCKSEEKKMCQINNTLKYLELNDDKSPKTKFDKAINSPDKFKNAGLLLNDKVVVVDFDNDNTKEERIIKYIDDHYETLKVKTTRGFHYYYSLPNDVNISNVADKITIGGFQVDYKTGNQYAIIKQNWKKRESNRTITLENLPPLPFILYPLNNAKNLTGLIDGDGRNNELFYHLLLIREQYSSINIREIAEFVNDNIFKDKLPKKELSYLIESVSKRKINYTGDKKNMADFAKFLVKRLGIVRYDGKTYFKTDGRYISNDELLQIQANKYLPLKKSQFTELQHQLINYATYKDSNCHFNIMLKNGMIEDGKIVNANNSFTPFFIDVSYVSDIYNKDVDDFLNFISSNKKDVRNVLEEIIGHILITYKPPAYLFFLSGNGANGKSTFANMLIEFIGDLSCNIDISRFSDGTCLLELKDKLLNVSDDIDNTYIEKAKYLKTLASGDTISERAIYGKPLKLNNIATLIFTANEVPEFKDKTGGLKRRIIIIPFENEITNKNPRFITLLSTDEAKSYILKLGLEGLERILKNGYKISESDTIQKATTQYNKDKDNVLDYISTYPNIVGQEKNKVYEHYKKYCNINDLTSVSSKSFTKRLNRLGYKVEPRFINEKSVRIILKK